MISETYINNLAKLSLTSSNLPNQIKDSIFIAERLDSSFIIKNLKFEHSIFLNISFKEATIESAQFLDCIFIGCYFRKSNLLNSDFIGCKFIECQFPKISVNCCKFNYSHFKGCFIPFNEMEFNLPQEPNLREDITRNFSVEASKLGFTDDADSYRKERIKAKEQHMFAAVRGSTQWYLTHFDLIARGKAAYKYIVSRLNGLLFGYGTNLKRLIYNFIASTFIWAGGFYYLKDQLTYKTDNVSPNFLDTLLYSLHNILPTGFDTNIEPLNTLSLSNFLSAAEAIWGMILTSLVAAYIFRWSSTK